MSWWQRWRFKRWRKRLGQEELTVRVLVSKNLLDDALMPEDSRWEVADLVAEQARAVAHRATLKRMNVPT